MKIAEKIKMAVMGLAAVATLGASALMAPSVSAETPAQKYTGEAAQQAATGDTRDLMSILNLIINVALGVIGFVAVVMIIMGGIQYTTSSGDAAKVTKAKNTILYGIIGLVIALLAFAIVNFVLTQIFNAK